MSHAKRANPATTNEHPDMPDLTSSDEIFLLSTCHISLFGQYNIMARSPFATKSPSLRRKPLSPGLSSPAFRTSDTINATVCPLSIRTPNCDVNLSSGRRQNRTLVPPNGVTMPTRLPFPDSPDPSQRFPMDGAENLSSMKPRLAPRSISRDAGYSSLRRPSTPGSKGSPSSSLTNGSCSSSDSIDHSSLIPSPGSKGSPSSSLSNGSCSSLDSIELSSLKPRPAVRSKNSGRKSRLTPSTAMPSPYSSSRGSFAAEMDLDALKPRPATQRIRRNSKKATLLSPGKLTSPVKIVSPESSQSRLEVSCLKPKLSEKRMKRNAKLRADKSSPGSTSRSPQSQRASTPGALTSPRTTSIVDEHRNHRSVSFNNGNYNDNKTNHTRRQRQGSLQREDITIGSVIPSDSAFLDYIDFGDGGSFDLQEMYLYSDQQRQFCTEDHTFHIIYSHTLRYKGDIVWQLTTTCYGTSHGIIGESSSCTLSESSMRVRICRKAGGQHDSIRNHIQQRQGCNRCGGSSLPPPPVGFTCKRDKLDLKNILLNSAELYRLSW